ncbi:hypothetical protein ANN_07739 [Periplaneta americana]|uniref:Uncharacterized protein n=1 Tax=Periplaneta americana TaxID=6978 RepID=A0ABQ8T0Q6_PERAM|nr:hypothetical protein ANN_07739 [Periplaneta americana]
MGHTHGQENANSIMRTVQNIQRLQTVILSLKLRQRIPNLTGPVDNNDVTLQRNRNKTAVMIDGCHGDCNQSDSLMAADGDCHQLCKLMAPVRHRWSINDVIGEIRNTVMPSDCSSVRFGIRS